MNKKNATIILIAMILFPIFGWYRVFAGQEEDKAKIAEYLKMATFYEEKGIYVDALVNYREASKIDKKNIDLYMKQAEMYLKLGDFPSFINACDEALALNYQNPDPYIAKIEHYCSIKDYKNALKVISMAKKNIKDGNEKIDAVYIELTKKTIQKYCSYSDVKSWHVQEGGSYLGAEWNGKWGIVQKDGSVLVASKFDYIGAYDTETELIPCKEDDLLFYADINGNRKKISDEPYEFLGSFGNGWAPAQKAGKYGYINVNFEENKFEFDYAGAFVQGIAAVQKNGKWGLIDKSLQMVTDFAYDEIRLDANGFCAHFNLILVKQGDQYFFIDHEGKKIGNQTFEDASMAASNDQPIAVKKDKKWGFMDQEGKIVMEPQFEEAKSFCLGLAPVLKADYWGYIDLDGQLIVEHRFQDAGVFSVDGSAPVCRNNFWSFLVLCEYDK